MRIRMKKKIAMVLTMLMAVGLLGGCGKDDAPIILKDYEVEKYVTLGEYKGLQVSATKAEVDQEQWDSLVSQVFNNNISAESGGITDRAVAQGDTVNISYVGKKDDVAFQGGTADGDLLTIGSGSYIDGFEDGLVGVMPGETVDLNLTFPDNYHDATMSGAEVVFTVTVNFIVPEFEDEAVASMGQEEFGNVEELRQYVHDYLQEENENQYNDLVKNSVLEAFMESCTFKDMPKKLVNEYREIIKTNIEADSAAAGVDADTYTQYYYRTGFEDFLEKYSEESARQNVALQAVANKEGLNVEDEELDTLLSDYAAKGGYNSVEEFMGENSKEDYREYFMFDKVMEFLTDNAVITG